MLTAAAARGCLQVLAAAFWRLSAGAGSHEDMDELKLYVCIWLCFYFQ